jgi:hypothetical protein
VIRDVDGGALWSVVGQTDDQGDIRGGNVEITSLTATSSSISQRFVPLVQMSTKIFSGVFSREDPYRRCFVSAVEFPRLSSSSCSAHTQNPHTFRETVSVEEVTKSPVEKRVPDCCTRLGEFSSSPSCR